MKTELRTTRHIIRVCFIASVGRVPHHAGYPVGRRRTYLDAIPSVRSERDRYAVNCRVTLYRIAFVEIHTTSTTAQRWNKRMNPE